MNRCRKCVLSWAIIPYGVAVVGSMALAEFAQATRCKVYCHLCGTVYAKNLPAGVATSVIAAHEVSDSILGETQHKHFMQLTKNSPMLLISNNGEPFFERYYMGEFSNKEGDMCQSWMHRFLRSDAEEHMHTHAWAAWAEVVGGWYLEQKPNGYRILQVGDSNLITHQTLHRVAAVLPNTWTMLTVRPERLTHWRYVEPDGSIATVPSAGADWWKACKPRATA